MSVKISALPAATLPLAGTELVPLVQGGVTSQTAASNIPAVGVSGKGLAVAAVDSGAVNAYVLTTDAAVGTLQNGQLISFEPMHPNTGACTVQVNGGSVLGLLNSQGSALTGGEVAGPMVIQFNTSQYNLLWILPLINNLSSIEAAAGLTPSVLNQAWPLGYSMRYKVDQTGTNDCTAALQTWIDAAWAIYNSVDGQGLWNGGGGGQPISTLAPGKYKVSNSFTIPTGVTVTAASRPANTTNYTRLIMNSTGIAPARTWTANTFVPTGANQEGVSGGTTYVFRNLGNGAVTGSSAPAWPSSGTVADGAVTWTNEGAITATDNRNNPIMKLSRATAPGGGTLANQNFNSTIQWLEFWSVTYGNSFSNPLNGASPAYGDYPNGGAVFIDCDIIDTRFASCVFQNTPCGLNIQNVVSGHMASDGFVNDGNMDLYIDDCEFDAAPAHIIAKNSTLSITFKNCEFFGGIHLYQNCTGKIQYENCRFYGGAHVDASATSNALTLFRMVGCSFEMTNNGDATNHNVAVYGVNILDISHNTFYQASSIGCIQAQMSNSGNVSFNTINDSGYGGTSATGLGAIAAIKLIDCQNIAVAHNNITATDVTSYNGFGILTLSSGRGSSKNFIDGNCVSAPYNAAVYNGQNRRINVASTADIVGTNYDPNGWIIAKQRAIAQTRVSVPYSSSMTFDASAGNHFEIAFSNGTAYTVNAPTNPTEGQVITIQLFNNTGGSIGTGTWNAVFKLFSGGAFAPNASGNLTVCLEYNGTNWYELWRSANSVPN